MSQEKAIKHFHFESTLVRLNTIFAPILLNIYRLYLFTIDVYLCPAPALI